MKKTKIIIKLTIFFLPIISLLIYLELNGTKVTNDYLIKKKNFEIKSDSIEILILGSSHTYYAIQSNFLKKAFNFSLVSQDLYYDLNIFNKYLNRLKNLKLVILSISYFSYGYDILETDEFWRSKFYNSFFDIPKRKINFNNLFSLKNYSFLSIYGFNKIFNPTFRNANIISTEDPYFMDENIIWKSLLDTSEFNLENGRKRAEYHNSLIKYENIEMNLKFLNEIIMLCISNKVNVVLLTTPVTQYYSDNIDKRKYNEMQNLTSKIAAEKNICYLNYFYDKKFDIQDYWDFDHLNYEGARKFSVGLNDTLKNLRLYDN